MKRYGEYLREITQSIVELGGVANLAEICEDIEQRGNLSYMKTNSRWRVMVKETLFIHCASSNRFTGGVDLFYPIGGVKTDFWTLKDIRGQNIATVPDSECAYMKDVVDMFEMSKSQQITLLKLMIGKILFRNRLKARYSKCVITGEQNDRLLVATRIVPAKYCRPENVLSADNGLLLTTTCDRLFSAGLISFGEDMDILVSRELSQDMLDRLNIDFDKVYLDCNNEALRGNLRFHRENIFKS